MAIDHLAPTIRTSQPALVADLMRRRQPLVMGVLNVTPDSFSDGGQFVDPDAAIDQARRLVAEGADLIDIGAESTRPYGGATPVTASEERRRLGPVLPAVVGLGLPVSVDTMKAEVAEWALELGATIVNDVWGLQRDPDMARIVAAHRALTIIMHNRTQVDPAIAESVALDPGIGFGKTAEQCLSVSARL